MLFQFQLYPQNSSSNPWEVINKFECRNTTVPFFWHVLGYCIMDVKGALSVTCGILSILSWMVYGIPQMILNWKKGIPHEAMSPWLLLFWTIGDTSNMVGAILTNQLILQIVMAAYAIFCDLVLDFQFSYAVFKRYLILRSQHGPQRDLYETPSSYVDSVSVETTADGLRKDKRNAKQKSDLNNKPNSSNTTKAVGGSLFCLGLFFSINFLLPTNVYPQNSQFSGGRTLLSVTQIPNRKTFLNNDPKVIVGYVLGCLSTVFYCSGRIPQIIKNFSRRCTEGLSLGLFFFAMFGNLFYGAQILLTSLEYEFMLLHLPWIIGSWGVMLLDSFILFQFLLYRNNSPLQYEVFCNEEEGDDDDDSILQSEPINNDSDNRLLIP